MSRSRLFALVACALAGATLSACDPVAQVQSAVSRQSQTQVATDDGLEKGECSSCAKFRARPPSGINVPPQL